MKIKRKDLHQSLFARLRQYKSWLIRGTIALVVLMIGTIVGVGLMNRMNTPQPTETVVYAPINLNLRDGVVVNSLKDELYPEKVSELSIEDVPDHYGEPQVAEDARYSYVYRQRLVEPISSHFAWYDVDGVGALFHNGEGYNGWYVDDAEMWHYYTEGLSTQSLMHNVPANAVAMLDIPLWNQEPHSVTEAVEYAILYQADNEQIWNYPEGFSDAMILTDTTEYVNFPMEVVEEMTVRGHKWLHVYNGYAELGWVKDVPDSYIHTTYSQRQLLDEVAAIFEEELSYIGDSASASFINNRTMAQVDVNPQVFMPASTQKIYVFAELYNQYKEGIHTPDEIRTMTYDDLVPGAGIIQEYGVGTEYSLDYLTDLVAIYSDNTAANMLIEAVGGGEIITPHIHEWGMTDTYVNGKYYHERNGRFETTPHDAALLFAKMARGELNGEPWDSMMIDKLRLNSHTFLRYYTWGLDSWNKSGLGEPEQNDVATFVTPYGSYSIAVYTATWYGHDERFDQVGRLSQRVYNLFVDYQAQLYE